MSGLSTFLDSVTYDDGKLLNITFDENCSARCIAFLAITFDGIRRHYVGKADLHSIEYIIETQGKYVDIELVNDYLMIDTPLLSASINVKSYRSEDIGYMVWTIRTLDKV